MKEVPQNQEEGSRRSCLQVFFHFYSCFCLDAVKSTCQSDTGLAVRLGTSGMYEGA